MKTFLKFILTVIIVISSTNFLFAQDDGAVKDLQEKMQKAEPFMMKAMDAQDKGNYDEAIESFNKVIELMPHASMYEMRGMCYMYKGDLDHAIEDLTVSINQMSGQPHQFFYRSLAYLKKKDYDKAEADLKTAQGIFGHMMMEDIVAAKIAEGRQDIKSSIEILTQAINKQNDDPTNYIFRADAYFFNKEQEKFLEDIAKAKSLGFRLDQQFREAFEDLLNPKVIEELQKNSAEENKSSPVSIKD